MKSLIRGFIAFTVIIFGLNWYFDKREAEDKAEEQYKSIAEFQKRVGVFDFRTPKVTIEYMVIDGEVVSVDPVTKKRMPDKVSIASSSLTQ